MTSQRQRSVRDLREVPYLSLDNQPRPDRDVVEVLLTGDVDDASVEHLEDGPGPALEAAGLRLVASAPDGEA
jgi:hypothetical protein